MSQDHEIQYVDIDDLLLDPRNPRLPESIERTEREILGYMASQTSIEDLVSAIAQNDYFAGEPVIAVPHPASSEQEGSDDSQKYVVVEGNRRLTAVKILQDIDIIEHPGLRLREIYDNAIHRPSSIPVIVRASREAVIPYLGYRHITGVKEWEPLAKARYIYDLFILSNESDSPEDRYRFVAKQIGSRYDHIKRNLDALAAYRVIEENGYFGIRGLSESSIKFGVLMTAINDSNIGRYVGVCEEDDHGDFYPVHPIINHKVINVRNLHQLCRWIYEKKENGKSVLGESRNIRQLSHVLKNEKATKILIDGASLEYAHRQTEGVTEDLKQSLYEAEALISQAASVVAHVRYEDELLELARSMRENIKLIGNTLKDKQRQASEDDDAF
ncbi:hypothetical protein [Marinobacter vinifirmus]|uniref:Chromosome partitioning protein ParB n=1 Tax=Marinobacter vinifirmus TaxID=355591 RepID=A0A558B990_9GAMM|nr:hypothetical protein [Marinobacter vinifirmus]TVT33077.1 MAG: chromosome partitioning protein ParB [Marinobacter vinifirmus]